jgi:hypothetical protein
MAWRNTIYRIHSDLLELGSVDGAGISISPTEYITFDEYDGSPRAHFSILFETGKYTTLRVYLFPDETQDSIYPIEATFRVIPRHNRTYFRLPNFTFKSSDAISQKILEFAGYVGG